MSKYPYIPKEYYAATMFACKLIRQDGFFNKAINSSAKYYGVDKDELIKHVRARQGAGQRGKKRGKYKKYRFKGIAIHRWNERDMGEIDVDLIVKATNLDNAYKQLDKKILGYKIDPIMEDLIYDFELVEVVD